MGRLIEDDAWSKRNRFEFFFFFLPALEFRTSAGFEWFRPFVLCLLFCEYLIHFVRSYFTHDFYFKNLKCTTTCLLNILHFFFFFFLLLSFSSFFFYSVLLYVEFLIF